MVEPDAELNELAWQVIGAAIEVHKHLGPGFLEATYEKALAVELRLRGVDCVFQHLVTLSYKGEPVGEGRLDMLVAGRLVVELKAAERILDIHKSQVISYLRATGHHLGLLINFNVEVLRDGVHRVVLS